MNKVQKRLPRNTVQNQPMKYSPEMLELAYLKVYIRCFLKAQHNRVGSDKGSLVSLTLAAMEGIFLTFLLPLSPWYRAILRNLSLFSTFPRTRETLFVCKFTTCIYV